MSFSNESDVLSPNNDHFTSTLCDKEILEDMDKEDMVIFHCMASFYNSHEFFTLDEIEDGVRQSVDPTVVVLDVLSTMQAMSNLFKINFTLVEFNEFASLVVSKISTHSPSTNEIVMPTLGCKVRFYYCFLGFSFRFKVSACFYALGLGSLGLSSKV
jgi:hypothetical protein